MAQPQPEAGDQEQVPKYRATKRFIWRTKDRLGFGTFGQVFQGYAKETGMPVAIKVSEADGKNCKESPYMAQHQREIEILTKLEHPNIVRAIGVESELRTGYLVLVMELVNGGSVQKLLESAEYNYGLSDALMLPLLRDIGAALEYLRSESRVVHRDLKPSNILAQTDDSGDTRFKLCDFGAARVLSDTQPFHSLVGTPEYLHPALMERAAGCTSSVTSSSTDLWSLGATLYHCACGRLPFVPATGQTARRNFGAWMEFSQQRPCTAIAGRQTEPGGAIKWSDSLPSHTTLSIHLRTHIEHLIRCLLTGDYSSKHNLHSNQSTCATSTHQNGRIPSISTPENGRKLSNSEQWSHAFDLIRQIVGASVNRCCVLGVDGQHNKADVQVHTVYSLQRTSPGRTCECVGSTATVLECDDVLDEQGQVMCLAVQPQVNALVDVEDLPYHPSWSPYCAVDEDYQIVKKCMVVVHWMNRQLVNMNDTQRTAVQMADSLSRNLVRIMSSNETCLQAAEHCKQAVLNQICVLQRCSNAATEDQSAQIDAKTASSTLLADELLKLAKLFESFKTKVGELTSDAAALKQTVVSCRPGVNPFGQHLVAFTDVMQQFGSDRLDALSLTRDSNSTKWHMMLKSNVRKRWDDCLSMRAYQIKMHKQFAIAMAAFICKYDVLRNAISQLQNSITDHQDMMNALSDGLQKFSLGVSPDTSLCVRSDRTSSLPGSSQSRKNSRKSVDYRSLQPNVNELIGIMQRNVALIEQLSE